MTAGEILNNTFFPVQVDDTVDYMLDRMGEYKVSQLPLVKEGQYLGLVFEDDLYELSSANGPQTLLPVEQRPARYVFIYENQHVYDVLRSIQVNSIDVLPVLDVNNVYLGAILNADMSGVLAGFLLSNEPSSIVVLELNSRDNSLAHIAQLVESDNAHVLNSSVREFQESTKIEVTITIDRIDINSILSAFMRHDYTVKSTFNDVKHYDDTQQRYDHLMNYLDI
ncbi:CBS domain-containing protein [Olivibacter sitiensis]|uniref:CBS domain-containing protein n=1 Tax=Olivibacter sitiensis TaxID=376470 RepID=UPI0003FD14E7|nr:CBS domain-containing protein [Olivibacter sitiensis]